MKQPTRITSALRLTVSIYVGLVWALVASADVQSNDKHAIKVFEGEVQEYVKLRNQVRDKVPKLSKDATPEQIQTMTAFRTRLAPLIRRRLRNLQA